MNLILKLYQTSCVRIQIKILQYGISLFFFASRDFKCKNLKIEFLMLQPFFNVGPDILLRIMCNNLPTQIMPIQQGMRKPIDMDQQKSIRCFVWRVLYVLHLNCLFTFYFLYLIDHKAIFMFKDPYTAMQDFFYFYVSKNYIKM